MAERTALDELMPLGDPELRRIARAFMRRQQPGHTLQPTALINEAFIKLFQDSHPAFVDRAHFLALMSRVMRQVLVDHARAREADKRGGGEARVPWDTNRARREAMHSSTCSTCTARSKRSNAMNPHSGRPSRCTISVG